MDKRTIPNIIETIKKQKISPTPRWIVIAKDIGFWSLLVAFSIIGGLFLSVGIADILDIGPDLFRELGFRHLPFFLFFSTPILWTVLATTAILFGVFAFRSTRYGYRWRTLFVASAVSLAAVSFSLAAHLSHIDDRFDRAIERSSPGFARHIFPKRSLRLSDPTNGILAGTIRDTGPEHRTFLLETPTIGTWTIKTTGNTRVNRTVNIESGEDIIVIGIPRGNSFFEAQFIRPLRHQKKPSYNHRGGNANF